MAEFAGVRAETAKLAQEVSGRAADAWGNSEASRRNRAALIEELGSESYLYAHLDDPKVKGLDGGPVSLVARSAVRAPAKIGESR